jgi:hypothetical protein
VCGESGGGKVSSNEKSEAPEGIHALLLLCRLDEDVC